MDCLNIRNTFFIFWKSIFDKPMNDIKIKMIEFGEVFSCRFHQTTQSQNIAGKVKIDANKYIRHAENKEKSKSGIVADLCGTILLAVKAVRRSLIIWQTAQTHCFLINDQ